MVKIVKSSEYNARAMQKPDYKNKICGYNFSYPVLNTINICNLFITGGSIEIQIERMGKSTWSFDFDKSDLIIQYSEDKTIHHISNVEELFLAMSDYSDQNEDLLLQKNLDTNMKKSKFKASSQSTKKENNEPLKELTDNSPNHPVSNIDNKYCEDDYEPTQHYNIISPKRGFSDYLD